jgi:LysM repeat protein
MILFFKKSLKNFSSFFVFLKKYLKIRIYTPFSKFEKGKDFLVTFLYKRRGKYAKPFLHFFIISMAFLVIAIGPLILERDNSDKNVKFVNILSSLKFKDMNFYTVQADEVRKYRGGETIIHRVEENETMEDIAKKYNLKINTLFWENRLNKNSKLKIGKELKILPIDGVRHKVTKGETIYSIGKKYGLDGAQIQMIIDYPFNNFLNEENFSLVVGQSLMVPEGVKKTLIANGAGVSAYTRTMTPDAGTVNTTGTYIWPAAGYISQGYKFYHKAIDIANRASGPILATDGGTIKVAGWLDNSGYGNRVVIDHGNGMISLYAHLRAISVKTGQKVNKGDSLGEMGTTGRSTGTHLHFEIRQNGMLQNPMNYLK